jgi:hypothetical protein
MTGTSNAPLWVSGYAPNGLTAPSGGYEYTQFALEGSSVVPQGTITSLQDTVSEPALAVAIANVTQVFSTMSNQVIALFAGYAGGSPGAPETTPTAAAFVCGGAAAVQAYLSSSAVSAVVRAAWAANPFSTSTVTVGTVFIVLGGMTPTGFAFPDAYTFSGLPGMHDNGQLAFSIPEPVANTPTTLTITYYDSSLAPQILTSTYPYNVNTWFYHTNVTVYGNKVLSLQPLVGNVYWKQTATAAASASSEQSATAPAAVYA